MKLVAWTDVTFEQADTDALSAVHEVAEAGAARATGVPMPSARSRAVEASRRRVVVVTGFPLCLVRTDASL
ncbi:hypothetical protein CUD01_12080 [Cellulomonas uda]|uniref:Uncharacterized protein n=1 Tax=Cellulomonas uda TaxID=1714 RepID=A0A4Y3KBK9_CELUD|nr:hypothetical protein CUD01_12080 [Cellulomonas uda]